METKFNNDLGEKFNEEYFRGVDPPYNLHKGKVKLRLDKRQVLLSLLLAYLADAKKDEIHID